MTNQTRTYHPQKGNGDIAGHLGQKRAQEEKESEEMLRDLGEDSHASTSSKPDAPKLPDDEPEREKTTKRC